ncbi:NSFL1 cofactor p47 [Galendromus occidentalis]|uniref:NSFL1 cofactor p47 n=1 Tax=Galendromus occidentalis TaxID=34638 RepID=A0AAJ6QWM9_9ACAR|nr:NSFL1 cofactor p47 [Galendromus occidentalis]
MSSNSSAVDELIQYFIDVTGVESNRAKFCLDSANWDLELALSSFYEDPPAGSAAGDSPSAEPPPIPPFPKADPVEKASGEPSAMSRMFTFRDLNKNDGSDSDEEGQRFFAGGSEHSGQQVVGPPGRKKINADDLVQSVFDQAKAHGATAADAEPESRAAPAFSGTGFRLGTEDTPESASRATTSRVSPLRSMTVNLWSNGFSIDDGPLRRYDTPEGQEFIDSIKKSVIPAELVSLAQGGEVNVDLRDRHHEEYVAPKKVVVAFVGEGHRLGNIEPPVVPSGSPPEDPKACEEQASQAIKFDPSKPATNVQIRLADGSRLIAKVNHSNTVNDLRQYIVTARPQYAASTFILMTTFPNRELEDGQKTVEEEKLMGAVVVQKLK